VDKARDQNLFGKKEKKKRFWTVRNNPTPILKYFLPNTFLFRLNNSLGRHGWNNKKLAINFGDLFDLAKKKEHVYIQST
jgi:hypothetical protein